MRHLRKHFLSWNKKTNIRIKLFIEFYYFLITHWLINTSEAHPMEFYILNFIHIFISLPKVENRKKHSGRWKGEINTNRKRCWKTWPVHGGTLLIFIRFTPRWGNLLLNLTTLNKIQVGCVELKHREW